MYKVAQGLRAARWAVAIVILAVLVSLAGIVGFAMGDDAESSATNGSSDRSSAQTDSSDSGERPDFSVLEDVYDVLDRDYVNQEKIDPAILLQGAIDGLLNTLGDQHTVYVDPESYELGVDIISGTYQGIGAQVAEDPLTGEIIIQAPFTGSPAERAGLRPGDAILTVDGESTEGWTVSQAVRVIRGRPGTPVELEIRHGNGSIEKINITRDVIVVQTVYSEPPLGPLEDSNGNVVQDLAYLRIEQFTDQTPRDMNRALEQLGNRYKGLILDLRINPGGGLDSTVQVADLFLEEGVVLTQVNRDGSERVFRANSGGPATNIPIVVLMGPGSASGAEVLAAALRDNGRATLVGEATFGKGAVNNLRELPEGGAVYVTVARWLTPNGEQIEGVGVLPDVNAVLSDENADAGVDTQLMTAIDTLKAKVQAAP